MVVTADSIQTWLSATPVNAANETDPSGLNRLEQVLIDVVERIRGTILTAGRIPLSLTQGPVSQDSKFNVKSVPPEGRQHTKVLTAASAVAAIPTLWAFCESDVFKRQLDAAEKWITDVQEGASVTLPVDPDPDTTPSGTEWGDYSGQEVNGVGGLIDMSTDQAIPAT